MTPAMTDLNQTALEPCPFCGGEAELVNDHDHSWIRHNGCPADLGGFECQGDAIAAWNRRSRETTMRAWLETAIEHGTVNSRTYNAIKALDLAEVKSALAALSSMEAGAVKRECATDACGKPATVHFERGGVGSDYCHECYMKVQALPATPEQGGENGE